jgi:GTP-binding protein EngB required for normal cell division
VIGRLLRRRSFLSDREQDLRAREQELLGRLARALEAFGPDVEPTDLQRFREATDQLAGLFLLVIAGEFNSGKSSFINALLGERVLPEGVTPTTDRINLLHHGPEVTEHAVEAFLLERTHPAELLRELSVVDTPGTNAVIRRHEELTRDFVPRADLVLFVTSADRPFSESEREFLERIREWGKKIVFIVNKIDILAGDAERAEVLAYVRDNATSLLGETPQVFPVSARRAVQARASGDTALWEQSGFDAVEEYLLKTLDQEERIRLKLLNPLNVGLRLAARYKEAAFERLKLLSQDIEALQSTARLRERQAGLRTGGGGRHAPAARGGGGPADRLDRGAQPQGVAGREPVRRPPPDLAPPGGDAGRGTHDVQLQSPGAARLGGAGLPRGDRRL